MSQHSIGGRIYGDDLSVGETAFVFKVDPRTIRNWCDNRVFGEVERTPGGKRRIPATAVKAVLTARGALSAPLNGQAS